MAVLEDFMSEVRFNWDVFPSTRLQSSSIAVPIGCLYTPFCQKNPQSVSDRHPISCGTCTATINQYVLIDRTNDMWKCPFCGKMTFFDSSQGLNDEQKNTPDHLDLSTSTVEYSPPGDIGMPPEGPQVFFLIVDLYEHLDILYSSDDSVKSLMSTIVEAIDSMPNGAYVALITFDSKVMFHQILAGHYAVITEDSLFKKAYDTTNKRALSNSDYFHAETVGAVRELIGATGDDILKYVLQINEKTREVLKRYLSLLKATFTNKHKPSRATGLALFVLASILSGPVFKNMTGTTFLFASGPCSLSPGKVINNTDRNEHMRSHNDIAKLEAPHFTSAHKYYQALALLACGLPISAASSIAYHVSSKSTAYNVVPGSPRWSFELFFGSLDQAGVYEMKPLVTETNGSIHLYSSFKDRVVTADIIRCFQATKRYNCELTVLSSGSTKVSKFVGNGHSLPSSYQTDKLNWAHDEKISDHLGTFDSATKKRNFTNRWSFSSIKEMDTVAVFFEPSVVGSSSMLSAQGVTEVFIQFRLTFWDQETKRWNVRVTTVRKPTTLASMVPHQKKTNKGYQLLNPASKIIMEKDWLDSFDQYAWAVLFTRLVLDKIDSLLGFENFANVNKDIRQTAIKLLSSVGGLLASKSEYFTSPNSLPGYEVLHQKFSMVPQLLFSLSRNPDLVNIFNSSPDETAFHFLVFMNSNCDVSSIMIDPVLYFEVDHKYSRVLLKAETIAKSGSGFFVLDSGFNVVIYHHIADNQRTPLRLHLSRNDDIILDGGQDILSPVSFILNGQLTKRPFVPPVVLTQTDHSQARFFMARLSPPYVKASPESTKSKSLWQAMKSLSVKANRDPVSPQYYNILSDDISFEQYCIDLFEEVRNFSAA